MTLYFIGDPAADLVKIGRTKNFKQRLSSLRSASANPLVVHRTLQYDHDDWDFEGLCHISAGPARKHGEWFNLHQTTIDLLADMPTVIDRRNSWDLLTLLETDPNVAAAERAQFLQDLAASGLRYGRPSWRKEAA